MMVISNKHLRRATAPRVVSVVRQWHLGSSATRVKAPNVSKNQQRRRKTAPMVSVNDENGYRVSSAGGKRRLGQSNESDGARLRSAGGL